MTALCLSMIEQQARAVSSAMGVQALDSAIELPFRIQSEANLREHWAKKAKRVKTQRSGTTWSLWSRTRPAFPCVVTMTRLAPRKLDDDNLAGGFKAVRDGVADWLGVNDNDPRVTWRYAQEKAKGYGCRISIEGAK